MNAVTRNFRQPGGSRLSQWLALGVGIALLTLSSTSYAGKVPSFERKVFLTVREKPVNEFIPDLFGQIGVPVIIDEKVQGRVNGDFIEKPAREVFDNIARSFGLVIYYDGAVAYVYTANDLYRRVLPVPQHLVKKIINSAYTLKLPDSKNTIRSAGPGSLVVSGTRRFIEQVEELVAAAESDTVAHKPPLSFKVFYLKYAWAQDTTINMGGSPVTVPGIANILSGLVADYGGMHNSFIAPVDGIDAEPHRGLKGQGLNASTYTGRLGLNSHDRLTTTSHIAQNPTIGTGDVRISVDPRLNAIIVRDSAERMSHYQTLIDALDVEPQMVEIEASIIDISTDKLKEMGVDWRGIKGNEEFLVGSADGLSPAGVVTGGGEGGILSFVTGNSYQFIGKIEALEKDGAAQIVSQPQVVTLSNVEAAFDNSSTFFVRVQGDKEVDLYDVSVGTSLRVTPHVFKDNGEVKIKLLVRINDGSQQAQQVDNIPVVSHSTINTQAIIQANESVLVGGLVREVSSESENRVPILGSIPLLGRLFRSEREHKERVERMFLITPRLINSSRLSSASSDKFEGVRLVQPQESAE